jgi:hypothetical protein
MEFPMSHKTWREHIFSSPRAIAPLAIFIYMAVGSGAPYPTFLGYTSLGIIAVLFVCLFPTKISSTQLDFSSKIIRRYYAHHPFRKYVDYNFDRFEIVLSEGDVRSNTVNVKLTGRHGSVVITVFGPSETYTTHEGHRIDHPKAHELRCYLAQRLNLRNIGYI